VLGQEVEESLRGAAGIATEAAIEEALVVVRRLLARITDMSLRSFREAPAEPPAGS
jgi:hypothetical protein